MPVPVARVPRPTAPDGYDQALIEAAFQALERELATKFTRKADLALEPGKRLVLTGSGSSNRYAIGVTDTGLLTVTDYATGEVGEFVIDWEAVAGLAQQFIDLRTEFEDADAALSSAYIAADAVVAADAASANATLSTTLSAAFAAADATVASNAAALVTSEASARASADSALASDITTLQGRVTTTEGDITTIESAAAAVDARLVVVESDYATATSLTALTAAVSSIREQALPTRPAIGTDFSGSTSGSVSAVADLSAGTVVAVANEGDVRQFTAVQLFRHKGYLPVISSRTYRVRARVRTTVDGTDNRVQVGFRYLDSTYTSVGGDPGTTDATAVVADGWQTLEYTRTGAQILGAAATSAFVTSRIATGTNVGGTSSGATTQVAWVELEDITDFATNAAAIVTTQASVTTEAAARASGDSANAATISTVSASVNVAHAYTVPISENGWARQQGNVGGLPSALANAGADASIDWNASGYFVLNGNQLFVGPKAAFPAIDGRIYEVTADIEVTASDGSCQPSLAAYSLLDDYAVTDSGNSAVWSSSAINTGRVTISRTFGINNADAGTAVEDLATVKLIRFGAGIVGAGTGGVTRVYSMTIREVTEEVALTASVTVTAAAVADIEGNLSARYGIAVDGGGNGALFSLEDGTAGPSSVVLGADEIILDAEAINFGADTVYEDTHNTFYTVGGSYRYRDRGPFGASSDLLVWYGLNSVALNSETKTNGVFAIATDGKTYFGSSPIDEVTSPLTTTFSPTDVNTTHIAVGPLVQAVTATPSGGTGPYTYVWAVGDVISGATPTLSGRYTDTCTVTVAHTALATIDGTISCTITDTVTGKTIVRYWGYYSEGTGGGGGPGGGGGLPP